MALHLDVPAAVPESPVELVHSTEDTATLNVRLESAVETMARPSQPEGRLGAGYAGRQHTAAVKTLLISYLEISIFFSGESGRD